MRKKTIMQDSITYIFLVIFGLISIFPFYWMLVGATNLSGKLFSVPLTLTFGDQLKENFLNLNQSINLKRVLFNSFFVSTVSTVLSVSISTLIAYGLSMYEFKGKSFIFGVLMSSMMIPSQVLLIPLFQMMVNFDLLNSYTALILPTIASPFAIFLMRQNFLMFPHELIESARLDGATEFYIFSRIVMPNMKPSLAATAIFMFMNSWNDFTWPLVVISDTEMFTMPLALSSLSSISTTDYGRLMLAITIATIPIIIVFLVLQKNFVDGMLASGIK